MNDRATAKSAALGALGAAVLLLFAWGAKPAVAANPLPFPTGALPPLISCPNYNGSDDSQVTIADVTEVISHYHQDYPSSGYWYLYDSMGDGSRGLIRVDDVIYVLGKYRQICPTLDTQIAKATQALSNPNYMDKLCDETGKYTTAVNCGGDPRFLSENAAFLDSKGYLGSTIDVPGQGVHYVNFRFLNGTFDPVRPPGLVYKNGRLIAEVYFAQGDVVGWGPDRGSNKHGVNIDAFCDVHAVPQPTGGCSWNSMYDGWHWHENLCTIAIGTPDAQFVALASQDDCASWALTQGVTCSFPPTPNFNCTWREAFGWMGHVWNWYPNANFTNASNGICQPTLCAVGESNGRFADCFPDASNWNAYNCPQ